MPSVKGNNSGVLCSSEGPSLRKSPWFVFYVCVNNPKKRMNRMLMAVVEKTKLGGVTSFDKWPGYGQQYGSEDKTSQKYGMLKKNEIVFRKMQTNIWQKKKKKITSEALVEEENLEKQDY